MQEKKNKALHWPIGIFLAIMAVVALSVWTINVANSNPVVMDEFYFGKYQDVDHNYNKIMKLQKEFDKRYNFSYTLKELKVGNNTLGLKLTDKANNPINDAKIELKMTRPFTNKQDIDLKVIKSSDGNYVFSNFDIKQIGRWQILSKVRVGELVSFRKTDINATK